MNGRIYDPTLGRFLQADPIIQAPKDSQSYNRYAYVRNNPLSLTDPSGYSWLSKTWKKIRPYVGIIVAAIGTYICGPQCGQAGYALIGAASGAAGAAANGGNIVTGALKGAFTAAAFYGVGEAFANCTSCMSGGELTQAATIGKIAAHAMVGGVSSVLQGGKFGHGFFAAGVTQGFAKSINGISSARFSVGRIAAAAVIGGTVSKITGGKFANGATTGAFSRMFNDEANHQVKKSYAITDAERALVADGKIEEFWESRSKAGDPVASAGLASLNPTDSTWDYFFGGTSINNRLQGFANVYADGVLDIDQIRVDLANAHIGAVDGDLKGIHGLLNPEQVAVYHHKVFAAHNLPATTFGGTPFTGNSGGLYPHRAVWCWGCDW